MSDIVTKSETPYFLRIRAYYMKSGKSDNFSRSWNQAIAEKLNILGCSEDVVLALGWPFAHKTIDS